MTGPSKACRRGVEGFSKGSTKGLTCKSKGSKGFFLTHAHKEKESQHASYARRGAQNPFDPFEPLVNPFANPFVDPFDTPSISLRVPP